MMQNIFVMTKTHSTLNIITLEVKVNDAYVEKLILLSYNFLLCENIKVKFIKFVHSK